MYSFAKAAEGKIIVDINMKKRHKLRKAAKELADKIQALVDAAPEEDLTELRKPKKKRKSPEPEIGQIEKNSLEKVIGQANFVFLSCKFTVGRSIMSYLYKMLAQHDTEDHVVVDLEMLHCIKNIEKMAISMPPLTVDVEQFAKPEVQIWIDAMHQGKYGHLGAVMIDPLEGKFKVLSEKAPELVERKARRLTNAPIAVLEQYNYSVVAESMCKDLIGRRIHIHGDNVCANSQIRGKRPLSDFQDRITQHFHDYMKFRNIRTRITYSNTKLNCSDLLSRTELTENAIVDLKDEVVQPIHPNIQID